jgi:hypothetical protein
MKRYNFCFSLLALFFNAMTFCVVDEKNYVTLFTKENLVRYYLAKELGKKDERTKDLFMHIINPLLIKFIKRSLPVFSAERLSKMNIKQLAYIRLPEKSKIPGHWFCFDDRVPKAKESSSLRQIKS